MSWVFPVSITLEKIQYKKPFIRSFIYEVNKTKTCCYKSPTVETPSINAPSDQSEWRITGLTCIYFLFFCLFLLIISISLSQDRSRMYDSLNMHSLESSLIDIIRAEQDPLKGRAFFLLPINPVCSKHK